MTPHKKGSLLLVVAEVRLALRNSLQRFPFPISMFSVSLFITDYVDSHLCAKLARRSEGPGAAHGSLSAQNWYSGH